MGGGLNEIGAPNGIGPHLFTYCHEGSLSLTFVTHDMNVLCCRILFKCLVTGGILFEDATWLPFQPLDQQNVFRRKHVLQVVTI